MQRLSFLFLCPLQQLFVAGVDGQGTQGCGDQDGDDRHGEYHLSAGEAHGQGHAADSGLHGGLGQVASTAKRRSFLVSLLPATHSSTPRARKHSTPSTVATAASPAAAAYFRSTSAPTSTKSMTSAHTHSLPNLAVSRSATGSRHRRRPRPMPSTASRPEKGTGITSSRATSRKATERRSTTFTESRMWSFSKNFASRKPTARPKTAPRTMDTGTPARADTEKEPPWAMEVKEVKRTMTNTSSTEAPAKIIWGIPFFVP